LRITTQPPALIKDAHNEKNTIETQYVKFLVPHQTDKT